MSRNTAGDGRWMAAQRKRRFVVTTDSHHPLPVYRNLARSMVRAATDQLWLADITYIRLLEVILSGLGSPGPAPFLRRAAPRRSLHLPETYPPRHR